MRLADSDEIPSVQKVKDLIDDINAWGPSKTALLDLVERKILPIKATDGRTDFGSTNDTFAIADRIQYAEIFKARVPILDFDCEKVHELEPFLFALGLKARFMSRAITENSNVGDSVLDRSLTRRMQEKAYALYR